MNPTYTRSEFARALREAGVKRGDVAYVHSNVGYFGYPDQGRTPDAVFATILGAFQDVLGDEGTLVVPTFTLSLCKLEIYDVEHSPSFCGTFAEMLRRHPQSCRSNDPLFSVAALGGRAAELTSDVGLECFGKNSFWERFLHADGIICNMNLDAGSTFIHYVERCLNVPYRYDKLFTGHARRGGELRKSVAIFFCHDLSNTDTSISLELFDEKARKRGVARSVRVGRGALVSIRASDTYALIKDELKTEPWFLIAAGKGGRVPVLVSPSHTARFGIAVGENASMEEMIHALWRLPRDLVSDGYDAAIEALSRQVQMTIHQFPTGSRCWTWVVPEKWTCEEAYLATLDGKRLFSYEDNPLHVASYSLPFDGIVSREELFTHLQVHARIPEAVPFSWKYYTRDWGLACSKVLKDSLTDERYRVTIKSKFSYGMLKVGEVIAPGTTGETIVLCAHLCHPGQVNDDLTGVLVGIEVMKALLKRRDRRYTYRFFIVPETIGSIALLSHNEDLIPKLKGGLFLEMLGLENPHALQMSFAADTEVDRCFSSALKEADPHGWTGKFRTVIGNDERQYNAPGVRVPMLSLSRVLPPSSPDWPYPEYHSDHDSPELASIKRMEESRDLVLRMIDTLEENRTPVNKFKGEVFCSGYAMHVDFYTDREGHASLFDVMYLLDGSRSIVDIANTCGMPFLVVKKTVDLFAHHGLVEYRVEQSSNADTGRTRVPRTGLAI